MPADQLALLKTILDQATHARFANASIAYDQMAIDHEYAIIIVRETTRIALEQKAREGKQAA